MSNSAFTPTILQDFREASVSQSGIVTTGTQSFAGAKTFEGEFTAGSSTPANIEHLIQGGPATNNVLTLNNNNASPTYTQIRFKMGGVSRGYVGASATNSFQVVNGAGTQFNGQCSDAGAWTIGPGGFTGNHTVNGNISASNLMSGVYTPTVELWAGTDPNPALAAYVFRWSRVGFLVTISGCITIDPTASGYTEISLTLPPDGGSNNFASFDQASGIAQQWQLDQTAGLLAINGARKLVMGYFPALLDLRIWIINATYQIV